MEYYVSEENGKGKSHVIFDTLSIAQRLESAGYTKKQAKVQAEIWRDFIENSLATKKDLTTTEGCLRKDMRHMEGNLRKDMQCMEEGLRKDMQCMEEGLRKDMQCMEEGLRKDMQHMEGSLRKEITISSRNVVFSLAVIFSTIEAISRFLL